MVSGEFLVSAHAGAYRRSICPGNRVQSIWWCHAGRWSDGTPRRHLTLSQAHPTQILSEEIHVGIWLRGAESGDTVTLREAMTVVALGTPLPGDTCLARATVPAQRSPRMGELVVTVGWVPRREEDHVIAVAKRHELQAPKPDHRGQWKWMFGVSHPEEWRENDVGTQCPLPGAPTVGVRSCEGPKPTSEFVLRVPNLDGDAKRMHEGLSWFGRNKALRPAGGEKYCISLHLSACLGVTSCERGSQSQVSEREREYKGDCLRC
jgi:hypothetical protein